MENIETLNKENTININGRSFQKIGDITTRNGKYSFAFDGTNFDFTMMSADGNLHNDNDGRYGIRANANPITNGVNIPLLTEKVVFANLCNRMKNEFKSNDDLKKAVEYISYANKEVGELAATMSIKFDFTSPEKEAETEREFQRKCEEIANTIDSRAKSRLSETKEEEIKESEDTIDTVDAFNGVTIEAVTNKVAESDENLDPNALIQILSTEELARVQEKIEKGEPTVEAIKQVLNERPDVAKMVNDGMTIEESINEITKPDYEPEKTNVNQMDEPAKVLKLTPPKNNMAAFADALILCLVAQLTIFITVLLVLFVMNK